MHRDKRFLSYERVKKYIEENHDYEHVTFGVHMSAWEGPYVRILYTLPDNFNPGESVDLGINSFLPPFFDESQIDAWIQWRMWRIEGHEARERFRVHDAIVFNPHEEGANALA